MDATVIAFRPSTASQAPAPSAIVPLPPDTKHQIAEDLDAIGRQQGAARALVDGALRRWMAGEPLDARDQRLVDLIVDTNWATQLGRLCIPQEICR